MGFGKWIGGVMGFMAGGPLGALAGYALGSFLIRLPIWEMWEVKRLRTMLMPDLLGSVTVSCFPC